MEPTGQGEVGKLSQVDAEAHRLCRAERYERTEAPKDTRAGYSC
jgi:hypothetical protein